MTPRRQPPTPLPILGCNLDQSALTDQLSRYRRLALHVTDAQRAPGELRVTFGDDVPVALLQETLALERGCCSFLQTEYRPGEHRLTIATADSQHDAALAVIAGALTSR